MAGAKKANRVQPHAGEPAEPEPKKAAVAKQASASKDCWDYRRNTRAKIPAQTETSWSVTSRIYLTCCEKVEGAGRHSHERRPRCRRSPGSQRSQSQRRALPSGGSNTRGRTFQTMGGIHVAHRVQSHDSGPKVSGCWATDLSSGNVSGDAMRRPTSRLHRELKANKDIQYLKSSFSAES